MKENVILRDSMIKFEKNKQTNKLYPIVDYAELHLNFTSQQKTFILTIFSEKSFEKKWSEPVNSQFYSQIINQQVKLMTHLKNKVFKENYFIS